MVSVIARASREGEPLTYHANEVYAVGDIVEVPFGRRRAQGIIVQTTTAPDFATKPIAQRIVGPLPGWLLSVQHWLSQFYLTHPAQVWQTILPRGLSTKRRQRLGSTLLTTTRVNDAPLTEEQTQALRVLRHQTKTTCLLHGVTGSGKTRLYLERARDVMNQGQSVIILTPEIALTPQLAADVRSHFPDVVITHSVMTEAERHKAWLRCLTASKPLVVVGPRSALFMPLAKVGLIVIDECHEMAYKQDQSPKYSALRLARVIADQTDAQLILGSATPSVHDYYLAHIHHTPIIRLTKRAQKNAMPPTISLVDMTKRPQLSPLAYLSNTFITQLTATLATNRQALLFHNRRGDSSVSLCESCGWQALCPHCYIPTTLHSDAFQLRCHLCGFVGKPPLICPVCSGTDVIHKGVGTKTIERDLKKIFPNKKIIRIDADAATTMITHYPELYNGTVDILIGTQAITKGLDLPHLGFVGVVQADTGLALPDYQSSERIFQLLAQVCGRVGRNEQSSHVVIQTYQAHHPSIIAGITQSYDSFYKTVIAERQKLLFPPFSHLLLLTCQYTQEAQSIRASRELLTKLRAAAASDIIISGPAPAFYERLRGRYRWQILVKSPRRHDLLGLMRLMPASHWIATLDPSSIL